MNKMLSVMPLPYDNNPFSLPTGAVPTKLNNLDSLIRITHHQKPTLLPAGYEPTAVDVVAGRGKKNWKHAGNTTFRELIRKNVARYIAAPAKTDKTQVVISLVDAIRNRGGRFLKLNDEGRFYDVGDAVARDKVGHSLRDQVSSMGRNKSKSVIHDAKKQANQVHPAAVISRGDSLVSNFTTSSSTVAMADTDSPIPDQQASAAMADMDSPIPDRQMSLAGPAEPADISVVEALSSALWVSDIWTSDMFDASQPMVSRSMFSSSNEEEE